nr:immunoglobulin heavy chain junction region [Macaca mulatta]MOW23591.1 immunoglobulin heavy chain junction region [Macaca mulatta]MOW24115.1 immunoglobulin heavy chain junction region [Macaca mulatta]MOW24489.1 immunoglobulin heavy chain junction region [Macaca mulatta]MOW25274.1 immunoglobulin heavy chain junction region [Macaca mulatta]
CARRVYYEDHYGYYYPRDYFDFW